jgi:O-antigen/teichoic acid export membrane protein
MASDVAPAPAPAPIGSTAAPHATRISAGGSLTRSAALTAVASLLDYAAQLASTLVVTPIIVRGLGTSVYGMWEMLRQSVSYMTATDGRPTDALRLVVANQQGSGDVAARRRHVGAALAVWLLFLPIVAVAGAVLVWLTPTITKAGLDLRATIRVTCALLVLSFLAGTLGAVPEAVLRGMNLGYKRMGWQAGLNIVGAVLFVGAVYTGLGLAGLGAAQLVLTGLTGVCFWVLVTQYVPAYGVGRPAKQEVRSFLHMSAWLTGGTVISHVLASSDVLILGMVQSPAVVATYVLTGCAARTVLGVFEFTVGAAMPGLGGVIGQQHFARAAQIRSEIMTLTWLFVTTAGATILLWNRSFLLLWVGERHYAGGWANLLLVCIAAQVAFIRSHQHIIDATLQPRPRVIVTAVAAVVTVTAALALTPTLGIVGQCLGILVGRSTQAIVYPLLVAAALRQPRRLALGRIARPLLATALLFAAAAYLGTQVVAHRWLEWLGWVALTAGLAAAVALAAGLPSEARRRVLQRLAALGRSFRG